MTITEFTLWALAGSVLSLVGMAAWAHWWIPRRNAARRRAEINRKAMLFLCDYEAWSREIAAKQAARAAGRASE